MLPSRFVADYPVEWVRVKPRVDKRFDPDEPRIPRGMPGGGRWTDDLLPDFGGGHRRAHGADKTGHAPARRAIADMVEKRRLNRYSARDGDQMLAGVATLQGFDDKPRVGTEAELDALVEAGGTQLWRGVRSAAGHSSTPEMIERLRRGDSPYYGHGIYGNGIYGAASEEEAREYARRGPDPRAYPVGGAMVRAVIAPDAKMISYRELKNEHVAFMAHLATELRELRERRDTIRARIGPGGPTNPWTHEDVLESGKAVADVERFEAFQAVMSDPGRFAALKGYDVIWADDDPYEESGMFATVRRHYNVLNRTVLTVSDRTEEVRPR